MTSAFEGHPCCFQPNAPAIPSHSDSIAQNIPEGVSDDFFNNFDADRSFGTSAIGGLSSSAAGGGGRSIGEAVGNAVANAVGDSLGGVNNGIDLSQEVQALNQQDQAQSAITNEATQSAASLEQPIRQTVAAENDAVANVMQYDQFAPHL